MVVGAAVVDVVLVTAVVVEPLSVVIVLVVVVVPLTVEVVVDGESGGTVAVMGGAVTVVVADRLDGGVGAGPGCDAFFAAVTDRAMTAMTVTRPMAAANAFTDRGDGRSRTIRVREREEGRGRNQSSLLS